MDQSTKQKGIEESMRRSSIPTSIPLLENDDCDSDEVSVVTTETFGVEIVAATKQEFLTRLKALTAARALTSGERVTKDECEELLYKIHAEQREKFGDSTSVDKSEEGDGDGAETADVEVVAGDADETKEVETRRRPRLEKSSLTESMRTIKSANKSSKKDDRLDDRIKWDMSQSNLTAEDEEDEERGSSGNDSRQEELSQLIELKLQLANQQELIDSLNAKLGSMSKVQERNNDLERENDVLWKKVMALQSASKNQSSFETQSNDSVEESASKNQCTSAVDNIMGQGNGSTSTEETAPRSVTTADMHSLYSKIFLPDSVM